MQKQWQSREPALLGQESMVSISTAMKLYIVTIAPYEEILDSVELDARDRSTAPTANQIVFSDIKNGSNGNQMRR